MGILVRPHFTTCHFFSFPLGMTYISSGRVVQNRSKLRLSYIAELFWGFINFIAIFFQTLISTEVTEGVIKRGQSRGYDRPVKRPIGTLHGKGGPGDMGDIPMGGG